MEQKINQGIIALTKRFDPVAMLNELKALDKREWHAGRALDQFGQIGLTCRSGVEKYDQWKDACGSLKNEDGSGLRAMTSDFTERTVDRENYPVLNKTMDEVEIIIRGTGRRMGRVRLMSQKAKTCLSLHRDLDEFRFHIPLQTCGNVFFVVDDRVCRMPNIGSLYILYTRGLHTVVNADSKMERLHLLFDTYKI